MELHSGSFRWFKIFAICLLSLFLFSPIFQIPSQAAPEPYPQQAVQAVQRAWELAQDIGVYHFATDVEQTTYPAPAIANVGRSSSTTDSYYMEGDVDSPAQSFFLTLWQGGGNVTTQKDGIEIRIEGGEAYGRPIGGLWQEIDDFSGLFAPGSDPMAYLAGATNIQQVSKSASLQVGESASTQDIPLSENHASRLTLHVSRFTFDLDGPAFAAHIRDLLEDQLRQSGELPPGLNLDTSRTYQQMTGQGEVWLDEGGLPLRLIVNLEMPDPKTGERVTAAIKTDFSNFARQPETALGSIEEIPTWDWSSLNLGNRRQNPGPFRLGGNVPNTVPFAGQLDEVTLYNHALSRNDVAEIFNCQGKWIEERQSHDIVIDNDDPTVALETTGDRLPNADVQMLITASDPTSGIQRVPLGIKSPGQSSYTWSDAPPCQDAAAETAWCPTFDPAGADVAPVAQHGQQPTGGYLGIKVGLAHSRQFVYRPGSHPQEVAQAKDGHLDGDVT